MDDYVYEDLRKHQEEHWWFKARREILSSVFGSLALPADAEILEIGCGTGGNLAMLGTFGHVSGIEMREEAVQYARNTTGLDVSVGYLPDNIHIKQKFDLICMLDVVEHIEDDKQALSALNSMLKPGGRVVITVPAYQWLFGKHDKLLHHFRRYSRKSLRKLMGESNIEIAKISYFNTLLLPIAILAFITDSITAVEKCTGYDVPPRWLNAVFYITFRLEKFVIDKLSLPFGCSLLMISKPLGKAA
jgi:2-polyprenyl-3-methyl-5-hydroxy-6-metoxy-1,4-benzoquinol methylase